MNDRPMSIFSHLEELRRRLILSLLSVAVCTVGAYQISPALLRLISRPAGELVFIAPQEALMTQVVVSFWAGMLLAAPLVMYQIWCFIAVGLHERERRLLGLLIPFSAVLFLSGAGFAFGVIVPFSVRFLLSFGADIMHPMISAGKYVGFVGMMTLAFGVAFQLPLVLLFLAKIGIVTPALLRRQRRVAVLVIFIAAAVLTPPDVVSQLCLAIPLVGLYEVGIACAALVRPVTPPTKHASDNSGSPQTVR